MIYKYLTFSISIVFISWTVALIVNYFFSKTTYYSKHLQHLNFINNDLVNNLIGLKFFKWIVKNTFFKFFNQKIKIDNPNVDLIQLRSEMTKSEIDHLIAFIFVCFFVFKELFVGSLLFSFIILSVNILMNLYPSLLQQENKRRLDRLSRLIVLKQNKDLDKI